MIQCSNQSISPKSSGPRCNFGLCCASRVGFPGILCGYIDQRIHSKTFRVARAKGAISGKQLLAGVDVSETMRKHVDRNKANYWTWKRRRTCKNSYLIQRKGKVIRWFRGNELYIIAMMASYCGAVQDWLQPSFGVTFFEEALKDFAKYQVDPSVEPRLQTKWLKV